MKINLEIIQVGWNIWCVSVCVYIYVYIYVSSQYIYIHMYVHILYYVCILYILYDFLVFHIKLCNIWTHQADHTRQWLRIEGYIQRAILGGIMAGVPHKSPSVVTVFPIQNCQEPGDSRGLPIFRPSNQSLDPAVPQPLTMVTRASSCGMIVDYLPSSYTTTYLSKWKNILWTQMDSDG